MMKKLRKMQADAETHAEEDKKKKEQVEARNNADSAVYTSEKTLKENGDKIKEEDKKAIEDAIKLVKEKLADDKVEAEELKKVTDELNTALSKEGEQLYKDTEANIENKEDIEKEEKDGKTDTDAEEGEVVDKKDKK